MPISINSSFKLQQADMEAKLQNLDLTIAGISKAINNPIKMHKKTQTWDTDLYLQKLYMIYIPAG